MAFGPTQRLCLACENLYAEADFATDRSVFCNDCLTGEYPDDIIQGWWSEKSQKSQTVLWEKLQQEREEAERHGYHAWSSRKLNVANDFSKCPGPRYISEGKNSGELFRETLLYPKIFQAISECFILEINLDGANGYGVAFLDEAFGGLVRECKLSSKVILDHVRFISEDEPDLPKEILGYIGV